MPNLKFDLMRKQPYPLEKSLYYFYYNSYCSTLQVNTRLYSEFSLKLYLEF